MQSKVNSEKSPRPLHADMMIKICGMKYPDNIASVGYLTPMMMGFIFHAPSPRDATGLSPEVISTLPDYVNPVAVTVNASTDKIMEIARTYGFTIVQLHGDESPEQCKELRDSGLRVIKAIHVTDSLPLDKMKTYVGNVDMFLFDTASAAGGGSGRKFDWSLLSGYDLSVPYLLSGGIGPDDIQAIIAAMRPGMAGIDINSGFETAPGNKNLLLLSSFILHLRSLNEYEPHRITLFA